MNLRLFLIPLCLPLLAGSCQKQSVAKKMLLAGQCIELELDAYSYQLTDVQEKVLYAYKIGVMGKDIVELDPSLDWKMIPCP
jgi:hypothetical protein